MKTRVRWNRHTLALVAIVAGMWYAAEAQSNGAAHLIALLTAAMGALSWLHARANLRGLTVRLAGARPSAQDEAARIPVELRASGAVSPCGLEVMVVGASASVFVERVPPGSPVLVNLPPPLRPAGGALKILVRSVYPLGLFTAETVLQTAWVRRVHPKPRGELALPPVQHAGQKEAAVSHGRHGHGTGDDFAGLREWQPGDSPRHIDWRALARGGPLMVKDWSAGASGVVVLDWNALSLPPPDRAAQIAQWMKQCEDEGQPYELRLPGAVVQAAAGPAHQRRCLDALALHAAATTDGQDGGGAAAAADALRAAEGRDGMRFEHTSHLPRRPMMFLCLALLLALWPMHGYVATAGIAVCALCLIWRGVLGLGVPHLLIRLAVILAGGAAVYLEYGELQGMEPGISLLLVLAGAKALESRTPREFQVLALIGWFLVFCIILLENHLSRSAWMIVLFLLIAASMVRFRRSAPGARQPARVTAVLFAQALPLALLLFFVFPRGLLDLNAALSRSRFGMTGIDNDMDPGSLAQVALSSEVAFRVRFPGSEPPGHSDRYWRCITLWECEGLRWTRGSRLGYAPRGTLKPQPEDVRQIIDLEPHGRTWIPALDVPRSATVRGMRVYAEFDQSLVSPLPIRSSERMEVWSRIPLATAAPSQGGRLPEHHREAALQLPENLSPRLKQLVGYWKSAAQTDGQIVQLALNYLATQGFSYTLDPGEYAGDNALEEFFLSRRVGFCEHFSGSFATLMRMAGVPARVVIGYLGGEYSDHNGGYFIVKQSDVHAWAEVWLDDYGWYRVDPTAALAPDRVNIDLRAWLAGGAEAAERQRRSLWWRISHRTRLLWDSLSYAWQDRVIDYDQESQRGLLESLGLRQGRVMLLALSAGAVLLVAALVALWLRRPSRHTDPWARAWQRVSRKVSKAGMQPRLQSEGPLDFAHRVSLARPDLASEIQPLAEMYAAGRYAGARETLREFQALAGRFKPRRRASAAG